MEDYRAERRDPSREKDVDSYRVALMSSQPQKAYENLRPQYGLSDVGSRHQSKGRELADRISPNQYAKDELRPAELRKSYEGAYSVPNKIIASHQHVFESKYAQMSYQDRDVDRHSSLPEEKPLLSSIQKPESQESFRFRVERQLQQEAKHSRSDEMKDRRFGSQYSGYRPEILPSAVNQSSGTFAQDAKTDHKSELSGTMTREMGQSNPLPFHRQYRDEIPVYNEKPA